MKYYAVIDTNVIVSALLTKRSDSATLQVVNAVFDGTIIPLYHKKMLEEYGEVLCRPKFNLQKSTVRFILDAFSQYGMEILPHPSGVLHLLPCIHHREPHSYL